MKCAIKLQFELLSRYLIGEHLNMSSQQTWQLSNLMNIANVVFGSPCMDMENDTLPYSNTSWYSLAKDGVASCLTSPSSGASRDIEQYHHLLSLYHSPGSGGYRGGVPGVVTPPSGPSMNIIIMPRVYEYHYCTPRVYLSAAMKRSTSILA